MPFIASLSKPFFRCNATVFLTVTTLGLAGCASNGDPRDPLEPMNRAVYRFNEAVDKAAMKPIAEGYRKVTPQPVQSGVRNFFSNLDDVTIFANNALQLKLEATTTDLLRVTFNSTFGLLGFLDVASEMGLKKHDEDFGQTLGHWGVQNGPYVILPFIGPSTVRDTGGRFVDGLYLDPLNNNDLFPRNTGIKALSVIDLRAGQLGTKAALDAAALDPYEFLRDVYLARRRSLIWDGNPPREDF